LVVAVQLNVVATLAKPGSEGLASVATARKLAILAIFHVIPGTFLGCEARDQNHGHAQDDEHVGKVERRPLPGLPTEIYLIDNIASKNSRDPISKCTAKYQRIG